MSHENFIGTVCF